MRRSLLLCALSISGIFLLSGCGMKSEMPQANIPVEEIEETTELGTEGAGEEATEETEVAKIQLDEPLTVDVSYEDFSEEYKNEEGIVMVYLNYTKPVLEIEEFPEGAKAINKKISEECDSLALAAKDACALAEDDYEAMKEYEDEYSYFNGYGYSMYFNMKRMDRRVISFTSGGYIYTGGAHGYGATTGYNFDAKTGKFLSLDDIFTDKEAAMITIKEKIIALADLPYYKERIFEDYQDNLDSILVDGSWYLASDGIHIISNPYMLGAYAAGEFEFVIRYEDMKQLKEEYQYGGVPVYSAIIGEELHVDMDGDGRMEDICLSVSEEDYQEMIYGDNMYPDVQAVINGQDYSGLLVRNGVTMSDYMLGRFYVTDLDVNDSYKELMITDHGDNDYSQTWFFRYDGQNLTYLGQVHDLWGNDTFQLFGDGTVKSSMRMDLLQSTSTIVTHKLQGDKLEMIEQDWYRPDYSHMFEDYIYHQILKDFVVYKTPDTSAEKQYLTPADGKVELIETDNKEWYKIQTETGESYYVHVTNYYMLETKDGDASGEEVLQNCFLAG